MGTIESELKKTLISYQEKFRNDNKILEFESMSKKFDELVEKGLVKKRGNNLLTTSELHIKNKLFFNIRSK